MSKEASVLQKLIIFLVAVLTAPGVLAAKSTCAVTFEDMDVLSAAPLRQSIEWMQIPTVFEWKQQQASIRVGSTLLSTSQLQADRAPDVSPKLLSLIFSRDKKRIRWFKHPYNKDPAVANYAIPIRGRSIPAFHTASRSVIFEAGQGAYSLKMATDHPMGEHGDYQPEKVKIWEDLETSRPRSEIVEQVDKYLGPDEILIVLRELISVIDIHTQGGYIIRDLRPLQDGHYYLAAHEVPTVGREIARRLGVDFEIFWGKAWAEQLGRAQARLALRYGFESEPTNPQNYFIQLDSNFWPTGKIVYQDLADSHIFPAIADAIGLQKYVALDRTLGVIFANQLVGVSNNWSLAYYFNASDPHFTALISDNWVDRHRQAYVNEIVNLLHVPHSVPHTEFGLTRFIESEAGQHAIRNFHSNRQ